ncbi:VOC family protein [Streptococcus catagoni]|uniref:VOC family protein n=1 Tax=Streptococcus catagoni TaxID=2654874 RepID=UPI00140AF99A|nr:VOC family protein [Streptococcus catagoni]
MISKTTTMLYVSDPKAAMAFWTEKMGFILIETQEHSDATSYEIAPSRASNSKFCIHDKNWVAKHNPGMNTGFPSLLFETEDLKAEYEKLSAAGVSTNPIVDFQGMTHFTFSDMEGNYMAIKEVKS